MSAVVLVVYVGIVDIVVQRASDLDAALQAIADRIRMSEPHAVSELKKLAFNMEKQEMVSIHFGVVLEKIFFLV